MAQFVIREGVDTYHAYGVETTFNTKASSIDKVFGAISNINFNINRSPVKVRGSTGDLPADNTTSTGKDVLEIKKGNFEAGFNIDFTPNNFRWLTMGVGSESGLGTEASEYIYPQATASTLSDKKKYIKLPSFSLSTNMLFDGTGDSADGGADFLGSKINSFTIKGSSGETVTCSASVMSGDVAARNTIDSGVAIESEEFYHFDGVTLEMPTSTVLTEVFDSFTFTWNNGLFYRHGMGTDKPKALLSGQREITCQVDMGLESTARIKEVLGSATLTDMTLFSTVTLKLVSDSGRRLHITMLDVKIGNSDFGGANASAINQNMTLHPRLAWFEELVTVA